MAKLNPTGEPFIDEALRPGLWHNPAIICDFCNTDKADYGFDWEWDANLCWTCHLMQNFGLWFIRYRARKEIF